MTLAESKLQVFKELISIENKKALKQIREYIQTFLPKLDKKQKQVKPYMSFEEWHEQFPDNQNLNEFIPEYGITLKEFRKGIYEAEMDEGKSVDEFQQKLKNLYEKA